MLRKLEKFPELSVEEKHLFARSLAATPERALGDAPGLSAITQPAQALREEKTRFIVVGMTAAILQGVPSTTLDVDLWIGLPPRQYIRLKAGTN